ncbi:hypothetical protein OIE71_29525 [Streptomyces sp. NBC_01725]|uniref:hypothetical protein n=1 Tax=Streptomyces sp. NBC_01725 TaxID=2975923 RepID=UPI002E2C7AAB|nr:hypothetical protein [Streptomyces sp. NBC_01725]
MSRPVRRVGQLAGRVRRGGRPGVVMLAGWLFADLVLVLALVSMADRPDPLAARPAAGPSPSGSPSPSPSPTPSPVGPRSVELKPQQIRVKGGASKDIVAQINKGTKKWPGRTAALVLTFGGSQGGTEYAHRVNSLLSKARPEMFSKKTATDDFHDLGEPSNTAIIRIYFYTSPR